MRQLIVTLIIAHLACACSSSASIPRACPTPKKQTALQLEDASETSGYQSVVLVISRFGAGSLYKCTGTIVSHNTVVTAAHCIKAEPSSTYVVQNENFQAGEYARAISSGISPKTILQHGTISPSATSIDASLNKDDLAILIFDDNTFSQHDVAVPSLFKLKRPKQFADTIMVGYGRSSASDTSQSSIRRAGPGFYLMSEALGLGAVYTFSQPVNPETLHPEGQKKYSQAQLGDSGGPLFVKSGSQLLLVGVASAGGPTDDGNTMTIYVDLFHQRSLDLFAKAKAQGAEFAAPDNNSNSDDDNSLGKSSSNRCLN